MFSAAHHHAVSNSCVAVAAVVCLLFCWCLRCREWYKCVPWSLVPQNRKGASHILRIDLKADQPDNDLNLKYILSFESAESLSAWAELFASLNTSAHT